ncbi:MAG: PAS domain-containing protein [Deltaproteobacteria bacterium]|nr:PAS domain-containing protein [Deltaproteobacteria bacterium]
MPAKKKMVSPVKKVQDSRVNLKKITEKKDFAVVGIGASAGGLETLEVFFSNMPPESGIAFVIIQHLSPRHKSIMASLLEKHTRMAIQEITDATRLEPNCVYLNPPDKNVSIIKQVLYLMEPVKTSAINMPIDHFFRTLSEDKKERAIAIILSGTASDGTLGCKAIKGEGGMVMVQDPDTARYDGMPRSAIQTGLVDFILPVEKMPEQLLRYIKHPNIRQTGKIAFDETSSQHQLQKIFALIRSATGHDFSHYKHSTIERRIERRLAVHQIDSLPDYILFIQKNPAEIQTLFKNLVIGVTSFFRDPKAYDVIETQVLAKLIETRYPEDTIRCWVVGCSTGEEAYSLAILISEAIEKLKKHVNVQIFATDIDEVAINAARKGIYPATIAGDVSRERLRKFFIKEEESFKIKKQVRDMVVFSRQSVIKDPPFSKLDLVSCRNLMIYLDAAIQKKIITIFHYTLNPGGVLYMGTSETIGEFTDLFTPVNSKWKVYQRKEGLSSGILDYSKRGAYERLDGPGPDASQPQPSPSDVQALAEKAILDSYAPSGVLVNDKYDILHFVGRTEKYLLPPTGRPSFNILSMARQDLKYKLTAALNKAFREKTRTTQKGVRVKLNGSFTVVDITVGPLSDRGDPSGLMLVVFEDKKTEPIPAMGSDIKPRAKKKTSEIMQLEQELQSNREYLQATIEELETSNEELKSTNEELQSVNEELQSANEELETSKEELQSTNEELSTVNSELQNKVDELSKSSNDMINLLAATEIASIFLDTSLCIKRYTPAAMGVIKLISTDIGRPISDLKTSFPEVDLADQARMVLKDLNTISTEILSEGGIWHSLKMMPYRTIENVIDGVVMTFINVHSIKKADKVRRLAVVLEDSNDAIVVLDLKGRIMAWNKGAEAMYGYSESEALKMNYTAMTPGNRPDEIEKIADMLQKGETIKSFRSRRRKKNGEILEVWLTATVLKDETGHPVEMALTERDLAWLIKD